MSTALLRQALELVDDDAQDSRKELKYSRVRRSAGQDHRNLYKQKRKPTKKAPSKTADEVAEDNLKKLLALSEPAPPSAVASKIIERAVKGKAIAEKIEINTEEPKSILFPEESFKSFEKKYFCS